MSSPNHTVSTVEFDHTKTMASDSNTLANTSLDLSSEYYFDSNTLETLLTSILEYTNNACIVIDAQKNVFGYNQQASRLLQSVLVLPLLKTTSFGGCFPPHIRKSVESDLDKVFLGDREVQNEYYFRVSEDSQQEFTVDSNEIWFSLDYVRVLTKDSSPFILLSIRDITTQKLIIQNLYHSEATFKAVVQNSTDYISIFDESGNYTYASPSFKKRFGLINSPQMLEGKHLKDFVHHDDQSKVLSILATKKQKIQTETTVEYRMVDNQNQVLYVETKSINLLHNPVIKGFVGYTRDISEKKAFENQLKHEAYVDTLTKIANRQSFLKYFEELVNNSDNDTKPYALLFIDLDTFKIVNDTLGHTIGDALLVQVASRLRTIADKHRAYVARLGGDEFTVIVKHNATKEYITELSEEIISVLRKIFRIEYRDIYIGCSIGINIIHPFESVEQSLSYQTGIEDYLKNADKAMYLAKQRGKGQYAFYNYEEELHAIDVYNSDKALREAFDNDEFFVLYEPIIDYRDGSTLMYESHLAWQHPTKGLLTSDKFVSDDTDYSLITLLSNFRIREVAEMIKKTYDFAGVNIVCSLNIKFPKSNPEGIINQIIKSCNIYSVDPCQICIDIHPQHFSKVESLQMNIPNSDVELIQYLDDFSNQFCNITKIVHSSYKGIKIDWSTVSSESIQTLTHLVQLFKVNNKEVFAYNINSINDCKQAHLLGINFVQGLHFSQSLSSLELIDYLKDHIR